MGLEGRVLVELLFGASVAVAVVGFISLGLRERIARVVDAVAIIALALLSIAVACVVDRSVIVWFDERFYSFGVIYDFAASKVCLIASLLMLASLPIILKLRFGVGSFKSFIAWITVAYGATLALVMSPSMLQAIVFYEMLALCAWGLVNSGDAADARAVALKVLITLFASSLVGLYVAVAIVFSASSSFAFTAINELSTHAKLAVLLLVSISALVKASQLPMYSWFVEAARAAPAAAIAFMHGAVMFDAGAFIMYRFISLCDNPPFIAAVFIGVLASATTVLAAFMYFSQINGKKLVAYATLGGASHIFIALAAGVVWTPALYAALYHLLNSMAVKTFMALSYAVLSEELSSFSLEKLPTSTATAFTITGLIATAGIPPFALFFSKYFIVLSSLVTPITLAFVAALLFESVALLLYTLHLVRRRLVREAQGIRNLGASETVSMVLLAVLAIVTAVIAAPPPVK